MILSWWSGKLVEIFQTKDLILIKYVHLALQLSKRFQDFEVCHIPKEDNARADLIARLASTKGSGINKTVIHETLMLPSIEKEEVLAINAEAGWMIPIVKYIQQDVLPDDKEEAR